jgi:hypothetical protein
MFQMFQKSQLRKCRWTHGYRLNHWCPTCHHFPCFPRSHWYHDYLVNHLCRTFRAILQSWTFPKYQKCLTILKQYSTFQRYRKCRKCRMFHRFLCFRTFQRYLPSLKNLTTQVSHLTHSNHCFPFP